MAIGEIFQGLKGFGSILTDIEAAFNGLKGLGGDAEAVINALKNAPRSKLTSQVLKDAFGGQIPSDPSVLKQMIANLKPEDLNTSFIKVMESNSQRGRPLLDVFKNLANKRYIESGLPGLLQSQFTYINAEGETVSTSLRELISGGMANEFELFAKKSQEIDASINKLQQQIDLIDQQIGTQGAGNPASAQQRLDSLNQQKLNLKQQMDSLQSSKKSLAQNEVNLKTKWQQSSDAIGQAADTAFSDVRSVKNWSGYLKAGLYAGALSPVALAYLDGKHLEQQAGGVQDVQNQLQQTLQNNQKNIVQPPANFKIPQVDISQDPFLSSVGYSNVLSSNKKGLFKKAQSIETPPDPSTAPNTEVQGQGEPNNSEINPNTISALSALPDPSVLTHDLYQIIHSVMDQNGNQVNDNVKAQIKAKIDSLYPQQAQAILSDPAIK